MDRRQVEEIHWGRRMRCYAVRPPHVDAGFRAVVAARPAAPALAQDGLALSYAELDAAVERLAGALAARGVRQGDRVAVYLENRAEAAICVLAIARIGAVLVPVGGRLRLPELSYILQDSQACALIYDAALEAEIPPEAPGLRLRIGGAADDKLGLAAFTHAAPPPPACAVNEDDLFGILYTSGTTGKPKGATLTHLGAVHSALHWHDCLALTPQDSTALVIPWSHVAGLCGVVLPFLLCGGRLIFVHSFQRRAFLELAARARITHALMVPAMYGLCLLEPDLESFDFSAWRLGVYGSAPMPEPTIRRFAAAVPHLVMCNAYGATETTSPATIMPPGEGIAHMDSIGQTVPCGDIRVMDENGQDVPAGEFGELWIAGPMVVPGYWRNDAATAAGFADGYWKSGDIGSKDAQGFVRIADRKKDMINRGGYKVYPAEVENVIADAAGVVEAAVVGQPDSILGERALAFVHGAGLSEQAVRDFCAARMADYKVPDWVVMSETPLPRNANGKIQKDQLRAMAAAHLARLQARR